MENLVAASLCVLLKEAAHFQRVNISFVTHELTFLSNDVKAIAMNFSISLDLDEI